MKKLLSLLLCLCLLGACACAAAETKTVTEFEDLTLETSVSVQEGTKNPSATLFSYVPYGASGDYGTNVNSVFLGAGPFDGITAKDYSDAIRGMQSQLLSQYDSIGVTLDSFEIHDAVDAERWGMKTFVMEIDAAGKTSTGDPFILYQRQLVVFGSFGAYCFTITSSDKATLDKAEEELIASVTWKK